MKIIYIHIGAHKTGTTSLQFALYSNANNLLNKESTLYPDSCRFQFAQHRLAFAAKSMQDPDIGDTPNFEIELSKLASEIKRKNCSKVIISSEELFTLRPKYISAIRNAFAEYNTNIIATVRRQDDQFSSIYNQKVKSPHNEFYRHYSKFIERPISLDAELDYHRHMKNWIHYFDKNNITLIDYETHGDIVSFILNNVFNLDIEHNNIHINKSLPLHALEIVRHIKFFEKDSKKVKFYFDKAVDHFGKNNGKLLSQTERKNIMEYFFESNKALFSSLNIKNPYNPDILEYNGVQHRKLTVNDVIKFMLTLNN